MITRFLPTGRGQTHTVFDQAWQAEFREILNSGRTTTTAQEVYDVVSRAAMNSGAFSPAEGRSISALVANDLFLQLGLSPTTQLRVPGS
jgi:tellurite resistance protein